MQKSKQPKLHRLKNHPFVVPVVTFLVLFMITMVAFIFVGGKTIGPTDSHIVDLYVDGQKQVLPSRDATVGDLLQSHHIKLGEHDVVEPSTDAQITDDNFSINIYRSHAVTIIDQGADGKKSSITTDTAQQAPTAIAQQAGIQLNPEDTVTLAPSSDITQEGIISQKIVISRAKPVRLNLYGITYDIRTHAATVADLMKERGIKYDSTSVSPGPATIINPGDVIFVTNPGKKIVTLEEAIPHSETVVSDPSLPLGQTKVQTQGVDGKKVVVYEVAADGTKKPLQEVTISEAITGVTAKGTKVVNLNVSGDKASILAAAGVPSSQYYAADFVISRESGWNLASRNSSGCLGLGQACPGGKLVNACPDWDTNAVCQARYFTGYASRYGGWQGAYQFWQLHGWW